MTFLQPWILWGLPLILVPVIIHLLNRLRHRPVPWAAMMFLRLATRQSTRYARLRQFLILLLRVLAVLALVLAVSRPLTGGWIGWLTASSPDAILILLDRSASMESRGAGGMATHRERALQRMAQSAATLGPASRLVLIESVHLEPQEVGAATGLPSHPVTGPTDTAAEIPALFEAALDWIQANQPGAVELWVASDLQRGNWHPESERWAGVLSRLTSLSRRVRVRLLGMNPEPAANARVALNAVQRRWVGDRSELELTFELERSEREAARVPLLLTLDGVTSQLEIPMEGRWLRYHHRVSLATAGGGGWGRVTLPADGNGADNNAYFVYGLRTVERVAVVAEDAFVGRVLEVASAPNRTDTNVVCERVALDKVERTDWENFRLVLWQHPLPKGAAAERLNRYVSEGGVVLLFPASAGNSWNGIEWSAHVREHDGEGVWKVSSWEEETGPLASSQEGLRLPVEALEVRQYQAVQGLPDVLARLEDGSPLLMRRPMGRGEIVVCATRPHPGWSRLQEGTVLVPLVQRLREQGGQRFSQAWQFTCGETLPEAETGRWSPVTSQEAQTLGTRAGIYQSGSWWMALNRPSEEDDSATLEAAQVHKLFGSVPLHLFEEKEQGQAGEQSELWRWFLVLMLFFLWVEGVLILPERRARTRSRQEGSGLSGDRTEAPSVVRGPSSMVEAG